MTNDPVIEMEKYRRRSQGGASDLLNDCQMTDSGKPIPNLHNALAVLRAIFPDHFAFDQMRCIPILCLPLEIAPSFEPRPLTDIDVGIVQVALQDAGLTRLSKDVAHQAVDMRAHECRFHPVRDYLAGLLWDGQKRLSRLFADYFGAEHSAYTAGIGPKFMISMVARVERPGCKADHVVVLEGKQGMGKSTACKILGGEWYSDALPDVSAGKDASAHLRGKWLVEVAELSAMNRAEAASLKSFVTRDVERFRPAYGRNEVVEPRQCIFVGTTNESAYLKDPTGGRRFWPVKTARINLNALARDRDQLIAEAAVRFRAGETWWPDRDFELLHIAPEQLDRYEPDVWQENIAAFIANKSRVQVSEIAKDCLHLETGRTGKAEQNRIRNALESLNWVSIRDWKGRAYVPRGTMSHDAP